MSHARHVGRAQGQQAAAAGHELVEVEMALATTAAEQVQLLHQAVLKADRPASGDLRT